MPWQILLAGALKERAAESVQAILDDLLLHARESDPDPSLASGIAGQAILHGYLAVGEHGPNHDKAALACLQDAIAAMSNKPTEASLYCGLSGLGWALAHLQGRVPGVDGEKACAEIDDILLNYLARSPWGDEYDLINGLVGFGVYALERLQEPAAVTCLERVIDRLGETAERRSEGITWWTNAEWLPAEAQKQSPRGYYNLGLAHGMPGVIALLGLACAADIARSKAEALLEGAVNWLLAQQAQSGFAHWTEPEMDNRSTRLAWCYGDAGVAAALLCTARCVADAALEREAVAIACRAARRPGEQSGVRDAGMCHGAAGLGHLFNRLFQATGEQVFADAAQIWFEQTLQMCRPGQGIGGYQAWELGDNGEPSWVTDSGLLTGSVGIALALLSATTNVEPAWDRMMLTAIPDQEIGTHEC
jgi:lantibiotic modifying enzyme